jgi:hypothetical protein
VLVALVVYAGLPLTRDEVSLPTHPVMVGESEARAVVMFVP